MVCLSLPLFRRQTKAVAERRLFQVEADPWDGAGEGASRVSSYPRGVRHCQHLPAFQKRDEILGNVVSSKVAQSTRAALTKGRYVSFGWLCMDLRPCEQ